jgi:putative ribosome biogenesis GTPase RsgA
MGNAVLTTVGLVMGQAWNICLFPLCAHTNYDKCALRHLFHTGNKRKWLLSELLLP